jgi:hypothetical protein
LNERTATQVGADATPGLNPHAQAEPAWLPVWTVNGDTAYWQSVGRGDDGKWVLEATPEQPTRGEPQLDIIINELGMYRGCSVKPDQMRAIVSAGQQWLASLDGGAA